MANRRVPLEIRRALLVLALPWTLAPLVARLIPSWYSGGLVALLLATVAGIAAFALLVARLLRRDRARSRARTMAAFLATPLAFALWIAIPLALLTHGNPQMGYFCSRVYRPQIVSCPAPGPEIYFETWQCWLGNLEYRVFVRGSFLPFYRELEPSWYRSEEDLPSAGALCAKLQGAGKRR